MIKNEQSKFANQSFSSAPSVAIVRHSAPPLPPLPPPPPPPPPSTAPAVPTEMGHQRLIDPNAIDITSLKGRFAWEKIPQSDLCVPVIFRGDTKYFSLKMLQKRLPDYPDDAIRRPAYFHYRKPIDLYYITAHEIDLLNRINIQHARGIYSRHPFTAGDEIVRVSDFLPFYDHLRQGFRSTTSKHNLSRHSLPPPPSAPVPPMNQRLSTSHNPRVATTPQQSSPAMRPTVHVQSRPATIDHSRENNGNVPRPPLPAPSILRHPPPTKVINTNVVAPLRQQNNLPPPVLLPQPSPTLPTAASIPVLVNRDVRSMTTVPSKPVPIIANVPPVTKQSSPETEMSSATQVLSLPAKSLPPPSTSSNVNVTPSVKSTTLSSTPNTSSSPHCGWLQINKLYTPFIASPNAKHHEYRIPLNLITYYDLLKHPSADNNSNMVDSKEALFPFEQTLASKQEIEMINALCTKHNITPFTFDTKLITLATFYEHSSANLLFIKELPLNEPKSSICKEWAAILNITGGICRLRHINSLQEQTVPFIGSNLLKTFILSSQCLASASLTKATANELEFLELILFFSNLSINLRQAQLVDIESVKKEYIVDLILMFNDKFPTNVLNTQQQVVLGGNRTSSSSSAPATNTIAESTPPPSPPSPANNVPASSTNAVQLPLTPASTSSSSSSSIAPSNGANRFLKTIVFRGHSLAAYICSAVGANSQRECVSIKSLCNILYPDHPQLEKLEMKLIRFLRNKNINRFRPQNLQSMGFTRLIDIRDAETHWESFQEELKSIVDSLETSKNETTPMTSEEKNEKRPLEESFDEEDMPVLERINKRRRLTEIDPNETQKKTRKTPSTRTKKNSCASWVTKYQIEDCCIELDLASWPIDMDKD